MARRNVQRLWHATIDAAALGELSQAVRRADPAAVVVAPHVITRSIKLDRSITAIFSRVPHERCYWASRATVAAIADAEELHVQDIDLLPETVILLSCPRAPVAAAPAGPVGPATPAAPPVLTEVTDKRLLLLALQRQLFHVKVHLAIQQRLDAGALAEAVLRQRIHRIGQAEFDEARFVLRREHLLLPPRDDATVYAEFAAVYLELRHFASHLLPRYFPTIWHFHPHDGQADHLPSPWGQVVEAVLADDVDIPALLSACHIQVPSDKCQVPSGQGPEPRETAADSALGTRDLTPGTRHLALPQPPTRLLARAGRARKAGNDVRAAILDARAASAVSADSLAEANQAALPNPAADIDCLAQRLGRAVLFSDDQCQRLRTALLGLLPRAWRGYWPREARLLYELQKACVDHERELFSVDAVQWVLALPRNWRRSRQPPGASIDRNRAWWPFKRPLPVKREVLFVRRLRGALESLAGAAVRLDESCRQELVSLLGQAVRHGEDRLREHLRGLVGGAMTEVGLVPGGVPEAVARDKVVEELIDRILERGFLTIGDLRDAIARNNLKLADVGRHLRPGELDVGFGGLVRLGVVWLLAAMANFLCGGELLRLDRRLAGVLDGAYRRGEIYLRWLHRLSMLAFGTRAGRILTRFLLAPFGGAFVTLEGLHHITLLVVNPFVPVNVDFLAVLEGLKALAGPPGAGSLEPQLKLSLWLLGGLTLYILALLNLPAARAASRWFFRHAFRAVRAVLIDGPQWLATRPIVLRFLRSRPVRIFQSYLMAPLLVTLLAWELLRLAHPHQLVRGVLSGEVFIVACLVLNTRDGRRLQELAASQVALAWQYMRSNIILGTIQIVIEAFRRALELVERLLYSIDEWLRFRSGGSQLSLVVKSVVSVPWFIVSYILRFVINLLLEPQFNPVKHFPVVTVSHKMVAPNIVAIEKFFGHTFNMSTATAAATATAITLTTPGLFGFLAWELLSNWQLFRANRAPQLSPAVVGSHGETMARLMRPGLHSGTLPKLYAKMRRAEALAAGGQPGGPGPQVGPSRKLQALQRRAHHIEQFVRQFAQWELVQLLAISRGWGGQNIAVGEIRMGSNRIALELLAPGLAAEVGVPNRDSPRLGAPAPAAPVWLAFEEHSGWLLAGLAQPGWAAFPAEPTAPPAAPPTGPTGAAGPEAPAPGQPSGCPAGLSDRQRQTLAVALVGFYKAAGVDLVGEQIEAAIGPLKVPYAITEGALVVWPRAAATGGNFQTEVVYELNRGGQLASRILFRDIPVLWGEWQAIWDFDSVDAIWPDPVASGIRVLPPAPAAPPGGMSNAE